MCNSSSMISGNLSAVRTIHGACPHDCPDTCALKVTVEAGRVVKVAGDPDHPPTHGALCTKVSRYAERSYHPERVLTPLKRVGPKGAGRFEPIGWDEALDTVATRLAAIAARDPQAILPYSYAGTMGLVQGESMAARFFHRLGASLLDRTICATAGGEALAATYGGKVGMHLEHFAESRLILVWGSNSIASNLHFWTFAQQAKRAGAKLCLHRPAAHRDRRQVPPAHRAAPGHRRGAGPGPDARAGGARGHRRRLRRAPCAAGRRRLAGAARARAAVAARARRRGLRRGSR
jgi:anaerobic selenocysteine-containing dehydrogenase